MTAYAIYGLKRLREIGREVVGWTCLVTLVPLGYLVLWLVACWAYPRGQEIDPIVQHRAGYGNPWVLGWPWPWPRLSTPPKGLSDV